ncbi:LAQU0S01e10594g1_1 [Lachancea quebecensis]|uniref:F-actin-capping protein subunit alpha n=1 Tax=Lachancea quebecensis TaxID=1654605 RepID=A0A0P1KPP0_9SACH|nr:LAQU0S01e10594g1_1 [Lachancea quebecensis]
MPSNFETIIESIISDAPSGEIQDVVKDLKTIAGNQAEEAITEAVVHYNIKNLIPIEVNRELVIISEYNKKGSKFFDPVRSIAFSVDHLNRTGMDVESYDQEYTAQQKSLYEDLERYASKNFTGDVAYAVYPRDEPDDVVIFISSTRYSPGNFWNGHWRSSYTYNLKSQILKGTIDIDVHYFEDGNVNFKFSKDVEDNAASSAVVSIKTLENEVEAEMSNSFSNLNEKEFKLLRRRLPVTRSKINWGKGIGTYRLGKDSAETQLN